MLDANRLKNRTTVLKLEKYEGNNEYLISLKKKLIKEGSLIISPSLAEYIEKNFNRDPVDVNKVVTITEFFGNLLKEQFDLSHTPEKIFHRGDTNRSDETG